MWIVCNHIELPRFLPGYWALVTELLLLFSSFDTPGVLTKTVEMAAWAVQAMSGPDPLDSTSADVRARTIDEIPIPLTGCLSRCQPSTLKPQLLLARPFTV